VNQIPWGRVAYVIWCNDDGKVLDDGTLFRFARDEFRLCCQERHVSWLLDSAIGFEVEIEDVTESVAALALQGPTSCAALTRLGLAGIETLKPFWTREFPFETGTLTVSRTGFTGDLGYELWVDSAFALPLWDRLMGAGREIRPIGSAALDMARIEAGFIQTNTDFVAADQALRPNRGCSPFELGLGRLVDFRKTAYFVGRRALLREAESKAFRTCLVGLDIEGNKPASGALVYDRRRREIGAVTSAIWSPTCKKNIALASIEARYRDARDGLSVEIYSSKELKWDKVMARCRIVERPFFNPPRRWETPARDF
jgi:aminomethyltransferase